MIGTGTRSIFASDVARKNSSEVPRPLKQAPDAARKPNKSGGIASLAMSPQSSGKLAGKHPVVAVVTWLSSSGCVGAEHVMHVGS